MGLPTRWGPTVLVVGVKALEGGGEAPPNEFKGGELGGESGVGAVERGGAVQGGCKAPLPPLQEVQGH